MNSSLSLNQRLIRSAVLRSGDIGYLIVCNPEEEQDNPHSEILKWDGSINRIGSRNFNSQSICMCDVPEFGYVDIAELGYYCVTTKSGVIGGNVFEACDPQKKHVRSGGFRSINTVEGYAYAVGFGGMVYRMEAPDKWLCMDGGLPDTLKLSHIHGYSTNDVYVVGFHGEVWRCLNSSWVKQEVPTNIHLEKVLCAGDGRVYVVGKKGIIIIGDGDCWRVLEQELTDSTFWGVQWYKGHVYISSFAGLYRIEDGDLVEVDFGFSEKVSCHQLGTADGVLWSIGEEDILEYDGSYWTRVVKCCNA